MLALLKKDWILFTKSRFKNNYYELFLFIICIVINFTTFMVLDNKKNLIVLTSLIFISLFLKLIQLKSEEKTLLKSLALDKKMIILYNNLLFFFLMVFCFLIVLVGFLICKIPVDISYILLFIILCLLNLTVLNFTLYKKDMTILIYSFAFSGMFFLFLTSSNNSSLIICTMAVLSFYFLSLFLLKEGLSR